MGAERARRAAGDDSASKAEVRPDPRPTFWQAPRTIAGAIKGSLKAAADKVLDWYAALPKSLRIGLLGSAAAFGLMGVVVAASNALAPMPSGSNWATVPETPATSMSVRITSTSGPAASTTAPAATEPATAQLPPASVAPSSSETVKPTATASTKSTAASSQKTTAASTQTRAPQQTTEPTTAAPSPTTAEPTTAPPTDPPTTDPSPTDPAPSPTE